MANDQTINFLLTGKNASLIKALNDAESKSKTTSSKMAGNFTTGTSKIGGLFKNLDSSLGNFGVPFTGALGKMGDGLEKASVSGSGFGEVLGSVGGPIASAAAAGVALVAAESIKAASAYDASHARLVTAVANAGQSFTVFKGKIEDTDTSLRKYGFTSTDTESSLATLVGATHNTAAATNLMGLAANIARGRNIDLGSATQLLVKVETGHVSLLSKLGINTKDATGHTISQTEAIKRLTALYKGDASAYAQTFAGKLSILKANADELEVAIGNRLIPVISDFASAAAGVSTAAFGISGELHKVGLGFGDLTKDVLRTMPGFNFLIPAMDLFHKGADASTKSANALGDAQKKYANDVAGGHASQAQLAKDSQAVTEAQTKQNAITGALQQAETAAATSTDSQAAATAKATAASKAAAAATKAHTKALTDLAAVAGPDAAKVANAIGDTTTQIQSLTAFVKQLDSDFSSSFDSATNVIDQFKDKSHVSFNEFVRDEFKSIAATTNWANNLAQLAKDGIDKGVLDTLAKAGPSSAGLVQAILDNVNHGSIETFNRLAAAAAHNKATVQATLNANATSLGKFTDYVNGLQPTFHFQFQTGPIPPAVSAGIALTGANPGQPIVVHAGGGGINRRAGGGAVTAGVPYVVGEHGEELFVPKQSGRIVPHGAFAAASGGSNITINVTANTAQDARAVAKVVRDELISLQRKGYKVAA